MPTLPTLDCRSLVSVEDRQIYSLSHERKLTHLHIDTYERAHRYIYYMSVVYMCVCECVLLSVCVIDVLFNGSRRELNERESSIRVVTLFCTNMLEKGIRPSRLPLAMG